MSTLTILCAPGSHVATATWQGQTYAATIGQNGPIAAADKREGDGHTPLGIYPLLFGFYRADRRAIPGGSLENPTFPWRAVVKGDGFCDLPADPLYNQLVPLGHPSAGGLWQEHSSRHDTSLFIGFNVAPIVPGHGSAVMLHGYEGKPTAACIAMAPQDIAAIAETLRYGDVIDIRLA